MSTLSTTDDASQPITSCTDPLGPLLQPLTCSIWLSGMHPHEGGTVFSKPTHAVWVACEPPTMLVSQLPSAIDGLLTGLSTVLHQADGWDDVATIAYPETLCSRCNGEGYLPRSKCGDCEGTGHFMHGHHHYHCKACEGEGQETYLPWQLPCSSCDGRRAPAHLRSTYGHDDRCLSAAYARSLQSLPGCQVRYHNAFFAFRFQGGFGLVGALGEPPVKPSELAALDQPVEAH